MGNTRRGSQQETSVNVPLSYYYLACPVIFYNITESVKKETVSSNTNSFPSFKQSSGVFSNMLHQHTNLMLSNCFMGMNYLCWQESFYFLALFVWLLLLLLIFIFFFAFWIFTTTQTISSAQLTLNTILGQKISIVITPNNISIT